MNVNLIAYTPNPDFVAGRAAAICVGGNLHDVEACAKALKGAMASGHMSVVEHVSFTFLIEGISRTALAQLTRHRLASFSVESQRYVENSGKDVVMPESIADDPVVAEEYEIMVHAAAAFYEGCLARGIPSEDARFGLLQGGTTRLIMTMNAREVLHFLELRCCNRAQWEIRNLADAMLNECRAVAPQIFDRVGCACMQGKPCPEGKKSCGQPRTLMEVLKR